MDKQNFANYIIKKYYLPDKVLLSKFITIDAMKEFIAETDWQNNIYFKGAMSLLTEHNYMRETPTKDIDFAIEGDLKEFNDYICSLAPMITKHYKINVVRSSELTIANNDYWGIEIKFEFFVKGTKIRGAFSLDVAIEEIPDKYKKSKLNPKLYVYSIEKTLAEKFISMIVHKETNGREKDFIDLKSLISSSDIKKLREYISEYLKTKKINGDDIKSFINNYKNYKYIKDYKLIGELSPLVEWIKTN